MSNGKRYTEEQILKVLKEIDSGASIAGATSSHGIGEQTIFQLRERFGGMLKSEPCELNPL